MEILKYGKIGSMHENMSPMKESQSAGYVKLEVTVSEGDENKMRKCIADMKKQCQAIADKYDLNFDYDILS